eukprot:CAMPEP_0170605938 /NCGR_PEP_ID=MMETSP0224-20130122/20237_1 /TAXON_ID=285029 /ORGANISM="Togula jolla, Strain CCCM 725" /LENGTH=135 /DNA_ID=CAMNT_0010930969 /DNA_START=352 /DNA_END=759 /DNA_ORIENTATION=-
MNSSNLSGLKVWYLERMSLMSTFMDSQMSNAFVLRSFNSSSERPSSWLGRAGPSISSSLPAAFKYSVAAGAGPALRETLRRLPELGRKAEATKEGTAATAKAARTSVRTGRFCLRSALPAASMAAGLGILPLRLS